MVDLSCSDPLFDFAFRKSGPQERFRVPHTCEFGSPLSTSPAPGRLLHWSVVADQSIISCMIAFHNTLLTFHYVSHPKAPEVSSGTGLRSVNVRRNMCLTSILCTYMIVRQIETELVRRDYPARFRLNYNCMIGTRTSSPQSYY